MTLFGDKILKEVLKLKRVTRTDERLFTQRWTNHRSVCVKNNEVGVLLLKKQMTIMERGKPE